jgi:hypothetical protein
MKWFPPAHAEGLKTLRILKIARFLCRTLHIYQFECQIFQITKVSTPLCSDIIEFFLTRKYIHKLRRLLHYLFHNVVNFTGYSASHGWVRANVELGTIRKEAVVICVTVMPQYGCIRKHRCICKVTTLRSHNIRIGIMRTGIGRYKNINRISLCAQSFK